MMATADDLLSPEEAEREAMLTGRGVDPLHPYPGAFGALWAQYALAFQVIERQRQEINRLTNPSPLCTECGTELENVDCERFYPVLRGDVEVRVPIGQPRYCPACMVGVEDEA